jgi:F0F1-type ATP synthase assembly protein I
MPEKDRPPTSDAPRPSRYAGMGIEFAAAVGGFTLLGWWIDWTWAIQGNKALLICVFLGLVGGTYNFVRQALAATREAEADRRARHRKPDENPSAPRPPNAEEPPDE